ncbi:hypothetical protein ACFX13_045724 [Malus domestica]
MDCVLVTFQPYTTLGTQTLTLGLSQLPYPKFLLLMVKPENHPGPSEKLQIPYLSPYLASLGNNFQHGANFATGGSLIRPGGYSPFHLGIQNFSFCKSTQSSEI